jgi:hypothetical protein
MAGQLVGHYRVLENIGAGAMGEVFRARDERLDRFVALKLIRPASGDNPDHLRRFEQEARAAAALNHPNILAIYDVGFEGKVPYIVSELLEGKNLRQRLYEGPIPLRSAADYALQIAQGLTAAHDRLIVHRDLKPENLFLTNDGRIKILDFGVAKLLASPEDNRPVEDMPTVTKHGAVIGTVAYMSPEQVRGKPVDHRSDIFSFGAILYEIMSGSRAFHGETEADTMTAVLREEPAVAQMEEAAIPAGYQDVVRHCLEKDPGNRFQSAKDLVFALQTLSGTSQVKPASEPKPIVRIVPALPWTLVTLLAVATAVLAVAMILASRATPPAYSRLTFEAGTVYTARFASNGQSVVYGAAWNNNPVQLFTTVGDSLLTQPLNLSDANLLAVSRSNELAVVLRGTHNGQFETVDGMLARAPLAGGSPKELQADVRWADWDGHGGLAVVHDVDGQSRLEYPIGKVLYQTGGWISNIRFSPQGDQIAFMNHRTLWDNLGVVCVVDLEGHVQTLTREWASEQGIAWRPDGKEIWFTAVEKGTNLNLMAVTLSGKVRTVLDLPVGISLQDIAPDGRVLLALTSKRLAMAFSTTLDNRQDVELSWHDWNVAKDSSRDGQSVLFEDSSEATGTGYAIALRKLDGTMPVRLGDGSAGGLSPDGKWAIAFTGSPTKMMLLPTGPGQPRPVETSGLESIRSGFARFLADGQRIIANGNEQGHATRCYALDLSGGKPMAVTPEGIKCGPSSPDNRFVVGVGTNLPAAIYPMAGGPPRPIPSLEAGFVPVQWSSDGSALFGYHSGELPSKIYKVEISNGKQTVVQELRPGAPAGVVAVSPVIANRDGTRFAYSYNEALSVLYIASGLH